MNKIRSVPDFNRVLIITALLVSTIAILACETITSLSFAATATPTRTRTLRPTFTPIPQVTATLESSPAPEVTNTPAQSPTPTRRAVAVATTRAPTRPPAPPPAPSFPVKLVLSYSCPQSSEVWEVIGSIRRPGSIWLENYTLAIFSADGRLLKRQNSVSDEEKVNALDISCQRSGVLPYNVKIDASDLRGPGSYIVRVIKSDASGTPLSPNVQVDFSSAVRWFAFFDVP